MKKYLEHPAVYLGFPVLLLFILFVIFAGRTSDSTVDPEDAMPEVPVTIEEPIPVQSYFEDGTHYLSGILTLPDPCYDIATEAIVGEDGSDEVKINLQTSRRDEPCATVITEKPFEVEFDADEDVKISATINGQPINFLELSKGSF